jgi:hypothetical protein
VDDFQAQMVGIVTDDPGVPISLAVYRFLRLQHVRALSAAVQAIESDDLRRYPYLLIFEAIEAGRIHRIKEGPSVRLYPGQLSTLEQTGEQ